MYLQRQYEFVKASRKVLLEYCNGLRDDHFLIENSSFGRGSVRNLLVHIGNTYEFWIGREALKTKIKFTEYDSIKDVPAAVAFFSTIDSLVESFISVYNDKYMIDIETEVHGSLILASPLKLFSHVI